MDVELHVVGRLLVAAALGAAIGIEREASNQPAGLRTHLSVALGAALFGIVSTLGFDEFQAERATTNVQLDVTRVASTVVTGIGFIGAGMIFRRGDTVHNLTTAASLWVVAAVGLACGVGDIGPAAVGAGVLVAALVLLRWPRNWLQGRVARDEETVRILLAAGQGTEGVEAALRGIEGVTVKALHLEKKDGAYVVDVLVEAKPTVGLRDRLGVIARRDDVRTMTMGAPVPAE